MSEKKTISRKYISDQMRANLAEKVSEKEAIEMGLDSVAQEIRGGANVRRGDLLARKIVGLALDPKKPNQWAVEMVYDRMEGRVKPTDDPLERNDERENQLDDITAEHLNLHTGLALQDGESDSPEPSGSSNGQAGRRVDLPSKRSANHQGQKKELDLAPELEETG